MVGLVKMSICLHFSKLLRSLDFSRRISCWGEIPLIFFPLYKAGIPFLCLEFAFFSVSVRVSTPRISEIVKYSAHASRI